MYVDGSDLKYRVLSTGVTTTVLTGGFDMNNGIDVIDGTIFTCKRWQATGYTRVKLDGVTDLYLGDRSWGFGFVTDTVNKVAYIHAIGSPGGVNGMTTFLDPLIPDLPPDPSAMMLVPRPIFIQATWSAVAGATSYRVTYSAGQPGANPETVSVGQTTQLSHRVRQLQPETEYTVYLYYATGSGPRTLSASRTVSTTQNLAENYEKSSFAEGSGAFTLTDLDASSLDALSEVMNEIFDTGDEVEFNVGSGKTKAKFVKRGGSAPVEKGGSVAIPFVPSAGAGQNATLVLSDSSSVVVSFDETSEELTIDGQTYTPGQSLVLDNQKVTVIDA